jgi:isoamylase
VRLVCQFFDCATHCHDRYNQNAVKEPAMSGPYEYRPGRRYPAGASVEERGVNFSIFSRHATSAHLLLYEDCYSTEPFQVIELDP